MNAKFKHEKEVIILKKHPVSVNSVRQRAFVINKSVYIQGNVKFIKPLDSVRFHLFIFNLHSTNQPDV